MHKTSKTNFRGKRVHQNTNYFERFEINLLKSPLLFPSEASNNLTEGRPVRVRTYACREANVTIKHQAESIENYLHESLKLMRWLNNVHLVHFSM